MKSLAHTAAVATTIIAALTVALPATANGAPSPKPPKPAVTAISPATGATAGGTVLTVEGTGLAGATAVSFNGKPATAFTVVSPTELTVTAPRHAAARVNLRVTTQAGRSANVAADDFTYIAPPAVTAVSGPVDATGALTGGDVVTVTGTGFDSATAVSFGDVPGTDVHVASPTSLSVVAPAHPAGRVHVLVTGPYGRSKTRAASRYTYVAPPTVSAVTPATGPVAGGTAVPVRGTGFTPDATVSFGSSPATAVQVISAHKLIATTPAGTAGPVSVTVGNRYGISPEVAEGQYTYVGEAPDTNPPGPVTGLSAGAIGPAALTLTWTDPTDADLAGIVVRRAAGAVAPASVTDGDAVPGVVFEGPGGVGSVTDSGLAPDTSYSYAVFARDGSGNTSPSATVTVTTSPAFPPGPVTEVQTTVGNTVVLLSWTPPADDSFDHVVVVRAAGTTPPASLDDGTVVAQTDRNVIQDANLVADTDYSYAIFACTVDQRCSVPSTVTVHTTNIQTVPTATDLSVTAVTDTSISLRWTNPSTEDGYAIVVIYRDGSPCVSGNVDSYTDDGLSPNTTYSYDVYVQAIDGARSDPVSISATTAAAN